MIFGQKWGNVMNVIRVVETSESSYSGAQTLEQAISCLCYGGYVQIPYNSTNRLRSYEYLYDKNNNRVGYISDATQLRILDIMGLRENGGALYSLKIGNLKYLSMTGRISVPQIA